MFNEPSSEKKALYLDRQLVSMDNYSEWAKLRLFSVTATDVASLSSLNSIPSILSRKFESGFFGNKYTSYGNNREPFIADWVSENHKIAGNNSVFYAEGNDRHLATPDGVSFISGEVLLAEIKTTNKPFPKIPLRYLRQIHWQQYVLGAAKTLFVWEEHKDFVPVRPEPECVWVERDDEKIEKLVSLADALLGRLDDIKARQSL